MRPYTNIHFTALYSWAKWPNQMYTDLIWMAIIFVLVLIALLIDKIR